MVGDRKRTIGSRLASGGLKLVFAAVAVALPALGVWIASSLVAFQNGSMVVVWLAGALAFPLLPLGWDAFASWMRQRRAAQGRARPRILTFFDRFVLRTLVVNLVFVGGLLALYPKVVFTALAARGDWMFDHAEGQWAEDARAVMFRAADGLEWLHVALHPNPYDDLVEGDDDGPGPEPVPTETDWRSRLLDDDGGPVDPRTDATWPFRPEVHPVVANMPAEVETSIESVARYIGEREPDPIKRVKALHDYVATRVAYDAQALATGVLPPQDAETTFRTRLSVCAGYANLTKALAEITGDEVVVVTGHAREPSGEMSGIGHAWNAAHIEGRWYLLDATWDAGSVTDGTFERKYETSFLMSPPAVFGVTHFPDDPRWQLRTTPISRGDFVRQPYLQGNFYALGMDLRSPTRSQTTVFENVTVVVDNPARQPLMAFYRQRGQTGPFVHDCDNAYDGTEVHLTCVLPGEGEYEVALFSDDSWLGALQVNTQH